MQMDQVKKYLISTVKTPYFLFVGDDQYLHAINELKICELVFVPVSDFCSDDDDDKIPDMDRFIGYIEEADINANGKKFVVTGLGEFLALRGKYEAARTLSRLKDLNIGGAKVILLLRGLASLIDRLQADPRFDNRRHSVLGQAQCNLSFTHAPSSVGLSALNGFKAMLMELEHGRCGNVFVNTSVNLDQALFTVHKIANAYEGIKSYVSGFALPQDCGSDAHWMELLTELGQSNGRLETIFEQYGFGDSLELDLYAHISDKDYRSWLYFIYLKSKANTLKNNYLRFVVEQTNRFEDFADNVLNAIIGIPHTDERFPSLYQERKLLVEKFPESDIANFVINSRAIVAESIYKLTDTTKAEREEIVAWLSKNGLVSQTQLQLIYPVLAAYLNQYVFKCPELADQLTDYFEAYKRQKLSNQLEPDFLELVDKYALSRKFNRLPTRDEVLETVEKDGAFLYWLDALGVEYLSLIEVLAQKSGLSIHINITRAELPTITSINKNFYDLWEGRKDKSRDLDDTKHHESGGYNFTDNELPIHLAKELDIIKAMMDKAATELALRRCKRFLIVSDHGASRLAVLRRKEEKYETETKGEHSGRCCKLFQPYDLPFAAEENGYLVLADYGRFKGSRAANVEVHGGAALEEVVIPVIILSLKDENVTVKLVDKVVIVDFRTGAEITLFINSPVQHVSVVIEGKSYPAVQIDENHHSVKLPDTKRAGTYSADVYAGDNLIGKITLNAQGKSGKIDSDFDDLF